MKGPIAPPTQQIMIENGSALGSRNTGDSSKGRKSITKSAWSSRSKIVDPWSESSSSPLRGSTAPASPSPPPPPPAPEPSPTPSRRNSSKKTTTTTNLSKVIDLASEARFSSDNRSRTSIGSKGTTESNPAAELLNLSLPPGSPGTGRKHRFHESPVQERPTSNLLSLPGTSSSSVIQRKVRDPLEQEQALFEQRLCEDTYGVAVRKINQYGKANLRYVKCMHVDDLTDSGSSKRSLSSRSASSKFSRKRITLAQDFRRDPLSQKGRYALVWGKKKDVQITLDRFVSVRVGKVTERAKRSPAPNSRVLSLLTSDSKHSALDIEAPTRMDRDKFARAFSRFLDVPLEGEETSSVHSAEYTPSTHKTTPEASASSSAPGDMAPPVVSAHGKAPAMGEQPKAEGAIVPRDGGPPRVVEKDKGIDGFWQGAVAAANAAIDASTPADQNDGFNHKAVVELPSEKDLGGVVDDDGKDNEGGSLVSSLTGHGFDQELVEELHNALNELRVELEDSRAEAARAVKVAEQAIQSAEKNSSQEWQNTVTHKAAEAAALAQKRSAEAMAKQRLAEERLDGERRTASFWRKQAEVAEEEAGLLQTRAAAAEVRKSAIEEQLESERRMAQSKLESMKESLVKLEASQLDSLNTALQKNNDLETELEATKRDLANSKDDSDGAESPTEQHRKSAFSILNRKKKTEKPIEQATAKLLETKILSSSDEDEKQLTSIQTDELSKLKAETILVRQQYEHLRRSTSAELSALPEISKQWTDQISLSLEASQAEIHRLRERLATESASRRKLLHEVQDLRGVVRVYCRPRPPKNDVSLFEMPSHETLVVRRDKLDSGESSQPRSFEFDRIFDPTIPQTDVYGEIQDVCLGVLDGFNITLLAFGQKGCGRTKSVLGEVNDVEGKVSIESHGIHLQSLKQLFDIAEHRSDRFKDTFSLSIVEVHNERLLDLLVGTTYGETRANVVVADSSSRKRKDKNAEDEAGSGKGAKLEIRSDLLGDTVVHGSLSVDVESFDEVIKTWSECITNRRKRLREQNVDIDEYESSSHVIATLKVTSANIATGHGVVGKLQFVDMAAADLVMRQKNEPDVAETMSTMIGLNDWKFRNRSLETLCHVIQARAQYVRNVPYRNSTLTHLLRDSLEGDTKVIFLACVSSDPADMRESTATLRLASRLRQVSLGKATKHALTSP